MNSVNDIATQAFIRLRTKKVSSVSAPNFSAVPENLLAEHVKPFIGVFTFIIIPVPFGAYFGDQLKIIVVKSLRRKAFIHDRFVSIDFSAFPFQPAQFFYYHNFIFMVTI